MEKYNDGFIMMNMQKLLDEIQHKIPVYYPEIETDSWNLEVISRRKQHNKMFLRLRVRSDFNEQRNLLLKIYMDLSPDARFRMAREFYLNRIVFERLQNKTESFVIPRPLDFFPEHNSILREYVKGRRLDYLLSVMCLPAIRLKMKEKLNFILTNLARFLILFNDAFPCNCTVSLKDITEEMEKLSSEACSLINNIKLKKRINEFIEEFSSELPNVLKLSVSHGDFRPSNVLVDDKRLIIIDWEGLNFQLKHIDLCNFVLHLVLMSMFPQYSLKFQISISRPIVSEYLKSQESKETSILKFSMLYTLIRMLNFYVCVANGLWVYKGLFDRIIGMLARNRTISILLNFPSFIDSLLS